MVYIHGKFPKWGVPQVNRRFQDSNGRISDDLRIPDLWKCSMWSYNSLSSGTATPEASHGSVDNSQIGAVQVGCLENVGKKIAGG